MSERRSAPRRKKKPTSRQQHNRGLLVATVLFVAAFAGLLAYLKLQRPESAQAGIAAVPVQTTQVATAPDKPQTAPKFKPKYDFYSELPKRELVIEKQRTQPRAVKETPPPAQQTAKQKSAAQDTAKKKPAAAEKPTKTAKKPVKIPKIELVSVAKRKPKQQTPKPATRTATASRGSRYLVQAGAYSAFKDADKVRAQLALLGITARVEKGVSNNKQVHRVRIGPVKNSAEAAALRKRLAEKNIPSIAIKLN